MSITDADGMRAVLELVIGRMKSLETELVAYAAVFLSLEKTLAAPQELDQLLEAARRNPDFLAMVAERYAPLYAAIEQWNEEGALLKLLENWEYQGPKQ
jgi:hypothetical protein